LAMAAEAGRVEQIAQAPRAQLKVAPAEAPRRRDDRRVVWNRVADGFVDRPKCEGHPLPPKSRIFTAETRRRGDRRSSPRLCVAAVKIFTHCHAVAAGVHRW